MLDFDYSKAHWRANSLLTLRRVMKEVASVLQTSGLPSTSTSLRGPDHSDLGLNTSLERLAEKWQKRMGVYR